MHLKTLYTLSTVILFCFSLNYLFAQPAQYRSQLNQMQMNQNLQRADQQMQRMMQTMNMRGVQTTLEEYDFVVTLRDSTKKEVKSAIYIDSVSKKRFIVLVDKKYKKTDTNRYKKIYAGQTLAISREYYESNSFNARKITGRANDSCWMFKVISGPISVYSSSCEEDEYDFNQFSFIGLQLNNGPIINFSVENLKTMVGTDIEALKSIEEKNLTKAVKKYNRRVEKAAQK